MTVAGLSSSETMATVACRRRVCRTCISPKILYWEGAPTLRFCLAILQISFRLSFKIIGHLIGYFAHQFSNKPRDHAVIGQRRYQSSIAPAVRKTGLQAGEPPVPASFPRVRWRLRRNLGPLGALNFTEVSAGAGNCPRILVSFLRMHYVPPTEKTVFIVDAMAFRRARVVSFSIPGPQTKKSN